MWSCRRIVFWSMAFFVCVFSGCQKSDERICEIEGVLKYMGKPIPGVQLTFEPDDLSTKATSFGMSDANGRFVMYLGGTKGVFKGKVRVRCDDPLAAMGQKSPVPPEIEPAYRALCEKYSARTSTYEITIEKSNKNFSLELD